MGGNIDTLRVGNTGVIRPPQMLCYRPRMHESDLVSNLERYVGQKNILSPQEGALQFNKTSMEAQKWASHRESPTDCIGGPKATQVRLGGTNRKTLDRGKQDVL